MFALTTTMRSPALRSKQSFVRWLFSSFGIRLDQSHLPANHWVAGVTNGRPEPLRFRFDPSISTTQVMIGEVAVVRNSEAPLLSAGLVALEGSNPYDEQVRFKLALLGWK